MINEDGWVIRNLRLYGNSVIPNSQVKKYGIRRLEEAISKGAGMNVKIRVITGHKELDPVSGKHVEWAEKPLYIVEIIN